MRKAIWWLIRLYQLTLSYWLGNRCRFTPTCSHYVQEAVLTHGVMHGLALGLRRVAKCGPFGGHGFDPVPPLGYNSAHKAHCTCKKGHPHG